MVHLDAVLAWLIQPERPSSRPLDDAIRAAGLTREQAVERAYSLFDLLLLGMPVEAPEETLGLKGETDPGVIKQRYRRLIAIYHPDRHPARSADLNRRTERINRAYRQLMQRHAGGDEDWTGGAARARSSRPSVKASPVPPAWTAPAADLGRRPPRGSHVRPLSGAPVRRDASLIQRRLIQAMVLGCAALLAILLLEEDSVDEAQGARSAVVAKPITATVVQAVEPPPVPMGPSLVPLKSSDPFAQPIGATVAQAVEPPPVPMESSLAPLKSSDPSAQPIAATLVQAVEPPPVPMEPSRVLLKSPYPFAEPPPEVVASASVSPLEVRFRYQPAPESAPEPASDPSQEPEPPPEVLALASVSPLEVVLASEPSSEPAPEPVPEPVPEPAQERKPAPEPASAPPRARPVVETPALRATAPALPAVPPIAKATAPPKTLQAPGSVGMDACAGVSGVLGRFQQAYQAGSADRLANLFTLDARERDAVGRAAIRRLYADWFSSTSGRNISFAGASTQSVGKDLCRIRVRFDVGYRDAKGHARSQTGQIRALFKRDGGRTLIQELTH